MNRLAIGPADQFTELPLALELEGQPYWLVRGADGQLSLLLAICPHAGGEVLFANGDFYCPLHFWTFDGCTGECTSRDDERLMRREVSIEDGILYAVGDDR